MDAEPFRSGVRPGFAVHVNDKPHAVPDGATLAVLAAELGLVGLKGVAFAVNGGVVARASWAERRLAEGDRVLVIRATQGG